MPRLRLHGTLCTLNNNNLMLFAGFMQVLQPDAIKDNTMSPSAFSILRTVSAWYIPYFLHSLPYHLSYGAMKTAAMFMGFQ